MPQKKAVTPWEKEFARLERRRRAYQARHARPPESRLDRALEDKVPPKLREALNSAFVKAFDLVFQRGAGLLERTFDAEAARQQFEIDQFTVQLKGDRSSLRVFSRRAGRTGALNLALSGAEGTLLGLLGIGLPDIPLFTGVLLKSLYQMAARYGYGWDTPAERYYLLLLVQGALSYGEELAACTALLDEFALTPCPPEDYDQGTQIRRTASLLADRLLAMKFVQGIPILGMAGGISDALCLERVQRYAGLNYHHRFLLDHRPDPRPFA